MLYQSSEGKLLKWTLLCTYFLISFTPILLDPTHYLLVFLDLMSFEFHLEESMGTPGLRHHSLVFREGQETVIQIQIVLSLSVYSLHKRFVKG